VALVGLQSVVSLLRLEVSPLLSTYDMYSTTYGSPAEYEQKAGQSYWIVGVDDSEQVQRCRITRMEAETIALDAVSAARLLSDHLRRCFGASARFHNVSIEATRVQVDWTNWRRLDEPVRVRLTDPILRDPVP
jgi:hypothetical protein